MLILLTTILMTSQLSMVSSHGRLWTPPGRGTMWRKGFHTPINYNDNQLYCGGFMHQVRNGYKCGICGDPYDGSRPHEAGGRYAKGIITANYTQGDEVTLQVQLTVNHGGWFEFKMCPNNDVTKKATHECLDKYPLELADGSGTKLRVRKFGKGMVDIKVRLPKDLTCEQCVLQWRYHAGNTWGRGKDGKACGGCGPQEEFYGCADVRIAPSTTLPPSTAAPTTPNSRVTGRPARNGHNCRGLMNLRDLDNWCQINCSEGYCPPSHCKCD